MELHKYFLQKILTRAFFLLAPAANPWLLQAFFPIGCMTWQHAVILESIWETDLTLTRFPASRTGLLTPRLTCFTLLFFSLLLGQNYSKSNSLSPFFSWTKKFLSPISLLSSSWTKIF